ncbi:hypothetical protein [Tomitella gaofuii]|uniref:hypothetical protein n=1 Tax=Tomitella gaofuii TaxID=2760083 RepID=UPI001C7134A9|nr:hypothetical protein [Tomitella gaofuii]
MATGLWGLHAGQRVMLDVEEAGQDGFSFRALQVRQEGGDKADPRAWYGDGGSGDYASSLRIEWGGAAE